MLRYVLRDFKTLSRQATHFPVRPVSRRNLSVRNDTSPGASVCCEVAFAVFSLSLAKGAMLPLNTSGSTDLACSVPDTVSVSDPYATVWPGALLVSPGLSWRVLLSYCHSLVALLAVPSPLPPSALVGRCLLPAVSWVLPVAHGSISALCC